MKAIKAVVFDLDGTLINSKHDYPEMAGKVETILKDEGVQTREFNKPRRIWEIIQGGITSLKELGLPPNRIDCILGQITEALNAVELLALDSVESMPGAHETLLYLRRGGFKIGIATRSGGEYAERSLNIAALTEYVDVLLARDEVEHPKPDPRHLLQVITALSVSPQNVVYVGDTTTDYVAAKKANIAFIGFPRNDEWKKRLKEAGCQVLVSKLPEITDIIEDRMDIFTKDPVTSTV